MSTAPREARLERPGDRGVFRPQETGKGPGRGRFGLGSATVRRRRLGPGGLTRRELEVLQLVASGMTNRAVARYLWVTSETVKFHLSNVYRKLGVANRAEASEWALRNGVSDREPGLRAM